MDGVEKAILAGGCFWGMQDLIRKRPGVLSTRVGYTGGDVANATYRNHGTHAEAIEIVFDPEQISYRELLELFFQIHDPTTLNRQGNDMGTSYRSAIFYPTRSSAGWPRTRSPTSRRRPLAREGRHGGHAGRAVLGSRARASGLPRAVSERVHLPLSTPGLGSPAPNRIGPGLATPLQGRLHLDCPIWVALCSGALAYRPCGHGSHRRLDVRAMEEMKALR